MHPPDSGTAKQRNKYTLNKESGEKEELCIGFTEGAASAGKRHA